MAELPNLGDMASGDWQRLQECADRFEDAWKTTGEADLNKFLPPRDDPLYSAVLMELVKSELEIRCRRGQTVRLESYLQRFPELAQTASLFPRLLYEEYRVRQMYGDRPALSVFQARFPHHFAQLQKLVTEQPVKVPVNPRYLESGGGYNLIKRIGSGGFGEVWLAEAPGGIKAAVKVLFRPVDHEEAQREIQSLELIKELRHPFLLQTQAYWTSEDRIYIVMELADSSLRDRLKECHETQGGTIPLPEMLRYFRESADALDFLHSRHVQHRDIKPENILLLQRHAKVADFGLARSQDSKRLMTASGSGTPFYMAPEVWRGKSSINSDQYSLAVAYAELRLDRRIFSSKEFVQLMYDHLEQTPNLDPLPEAEQEVLRRALAKEPEHRYQSCGEFVEALHAALVHQLGPSRPDLSLSAASGGAGPRRASGEVAYGTIRPGLNVGLSADTPSALAEGTQASVPSLQAVSLRRRQATQRMLWMIAAGFVVCLAVALGVGYYFGGTRTWLPPGEGWQAIGDRVEASRSLAFHERIARVVDGERVEFVLIRKRPGTDDPPAFYLMENKVWVAFFRKFAAAHPEQIKGKEWEDLDTNRRNERFPIFGVAIEDAHRCALWLGGKLPSRRQWDKAAGLMDEIEVEGERGPFEPDWEPGEIAVDREKLGPMPVGTAMKDRSRFGIRDMAGNGREWTRDLSGNVEVPLANPERTHRVLLRGRSFVETKPLRFWDLKHDRDDSALYIPDPKTEPDEVDISFRVVVEIEL